ncbi:uncharacterized protein LOC132981758 [Labrus mixtus]|uniref:uncharacterized protein LOC132981758 n=1 Tax=Labrus mixtus TaxID=508554 RepID=UPI0029C06F3B|nr:uncharacterized protein LOC132981758 [Labrus mixtus]
MDSLLWDAVQSLRRGRDPKHQSDANNSMDNASESNNNAQETYCEYSRCTNDRPQSIVGVNVGWEEPIPASCDFYNKESEAEDPDGAPLLEEDEDPELARKRNELREIEERIQQKRVSIALKKVVHVVNKASHGFSCNGESDGCEGPTLKGRVNAILQQRHSHSFLSKVHAPKEGPNSSSLPRDRHPLKLRVKAIMKQKHTDPVVLPTYREVADIPVPPPGQRKYAAEKEATSVDLGFQRFLSVLNKGEMPPPDHAESSKEKEAINNHLGFQNILNLFDKRKIPPRVQRAEKVQQFPSVLNKREMPPKGLEETSGKKEANSVNLSVQQFPSVLNKREMPPKGLEETSGKKEANSVNLGFQRFLSVLNKGVDMDVLSRIVNADSEVPLLGEEVLNIQPPPLENRLNLPFKNDSQRSTSGASLENHSSSSSRERKTDSQGHERSSSGSTFLSDDKKKNDRGECCFASSSCSKRSNSGASLESHSPISSGETKTKPIGRERSIIQGLSQADHRKDRGNHCFASSSRSKSPPVVKKKKKKEETPKVEEHQEHLQNILKTLGFSLEMEEMSKLADRTQERLYGKKRVESRGEQQSQQIVSHKHHRNFSPSSSSSSSSSSYSRSASRSSSPSPSRRLSYDRDSKQRRRSGRSRSKDISRDRLNQDGHQDSKKGKTQWDRDKDRKLCEETSVYDNPHTHQPIPVCQNSYPPGFPEFQNNNFPQYSDCDAYPSNTSVTATESCWVDPQDAYPAPFYTSRYPNLQHSFHHFPGPVAAPTKVRHCRLDINLLVNPDLSRSEGQVGPASRTRCLHVLTTQQPTSSGYLKVLAGGQMMNKKPKFRNQRQRRKHRNKLKLAQMAKFDVMEVTEKREKREKREEAPQKNEKDCLSEEEKQVPTEEEVKKNLRKMLDAFNQKPKPNVIQPYTSVPFETD